MKQPITIILLFFLSFQLYSQDSLIIRYKTVGIEYFGELGLHPGLKLDVGLPIWTNTALRGKKGRIFFQKLIARPNIGYYHIPRYTHNEQ